MSNSIIFEYADYDKVGNRLSCQINDANTQMYYYDVLYQLITVDYNDGNLTDYFYDVLGSRLTMTVDGNEVHSYNYNDTAKPRGVYLWQR